MCFDVDDARAALLLERLSAALRDVSVAVELLWDSSSVQARFENTGGVSPEVCQQLGLVGPAAGHEDAAALFHQGGDDQDAPPWLGGGGAISGGRRRRHGDR